MPESTNVFQEKTNLPCRTCVDFKTWAKQQSNSFSKSVKSSGSADDDKLKDTQKERDAPGRPDCPLDKDQLGQATWSFLHTLAAVYPEKPSQEQITDTKSFFNLMGRLYPCEYCAKDLTEELKKEPPQVSTNEEFSQWLCRLHNKVNTKLGKPEFDCKLVNQRWKDGWLDGSCD